MAQDGMPDTGPSHPLLTHPSWCDQSTCTVADSWPYGCHQSASHVVAADAPCTTVAELHLVSTMPGLSPDTLLLLDVDRAGDPGGAPLPVPLTLGQARELHTALDKLLAAAASA